MFETTLQSIEYADLQALDRLELLALLNKEKIRAHLVAHAQFDATSLEAWIADKVKVDTAQGCRVRGIKVKGAVAGWCGIQFEDGAYELAIVLDAAYWGIGMRVFKELMGWAAELGHASVVLHLLNTRPESRFLKKIALRVSETTLFGQKYTRYTLKVPAV